MRYYIIAGERSGDLHGSNLVKEIRKQDPKAVFRGLGGDYLRDAGVFYRKYDGAETNERSSSGRNRFSTRSVQTWTVSHRLWARVTSFDTFRQIPFNAGG